MHLRQVAGFNIAINIYLSEIEHQKPETCFYRLPDSFFFIILHLMFVIVCIVSAHYLLISSHHASIIYRHSPAPIVSNDAGVYTSHYMRTSPVPPLVHQSGDVPISPSVPLSPESAKQILISYVRAEASQYALDLKQELEALNFSVYLVSIL